MRPGDIRIAGFVVRCGCDCGCVLRGLDVRDHGWDDPYVDARPAFELWLRNQGWSVDGIRWVCPPCSAGVCEDLS